MRAGKRAEIFLIVCMLGVGLTAGAAQERPAGLLDLTDAQVRLISRHGPWPQSWTTDPTNRASGNAEAIALGRRLFFDARLAPSGRISCSSCHRPERGWTDGRAQGIGLEPGNRNTPTLFDVRLNRRFGWNGGADSLWAQSVRPLIDPREMGSSATHVRQYLAADPELARAYRAVFGRPVSDTDAELVLVDAAKALAAYLETIVSGRTTFDDFRDALVAGDAAAAARYPLAAQRGLGLFIGRGQCSRCHAGPAFTDGTLHDVGAPPQAAPSITELLATRYGVAGPYNDNPSAVPQVEMGRTDRGRVRVPTLRNLARTAPYMHDGALATLGDAIRRHPGLAAVALGEREMADLVAFLASLGE